MKNRILILLLVIVWLALTACSYPSDNFCTEVPSCYHFDPIHGGQNGGK